MRVKFITLGCKVNQYETQGLRERFVSLGCEVTDGVSDLYVINGCSVTRRADYKSKAAVIRAKTENPQAKVAACGCFASAVKDFFNPADIDYIVPQERKHLLPEIVLGLSSGEPDTGQADQRWSLTISHFFNRRAFVKVQDGCNNSCSFCKIPHLRGPAVSRPKQEAVEEVIRVSNLHREIVLCGVNLSLYGKDLQPPCALSDLVGSILDLPVLGRLRLSSLEPASIDKALFSFFRHSRLCPHLHFPFQSGDDGVLKAMNKLASTSVYQAAVRQARKIRPDIAISCDVMVGFPAEDEKGFQNTLNFLRKVEPMRMHIFTFSPREGTPLWTTKVKNQNLIRKRFKILKSLGDEFAKNYQQRFLGKKLGLIAEEQNQNFTTGYTENYLRVRIEGKVPLGEIIPVRIEKIKDSQIFASYAPQSYR